MAAIQATLVGTAYGPGGGQSPITIVGELSYTGLGVGGGPMPGGPPLGFWGGYRPPYVDIGLPVPQPPGPIGIWPNPPEGSVLPEHPIVLPPNLPPTLPPPDQRPVDWKVQVVWTPTDGWSTVIVGKPTGPTPTPSAAPSKK